MAGFGRWQCTVISGILGVLLSFWGLAVWFLRIFMEKIPMVVPAFMVSLGFATFFFFWMSYLWEDLFEDSDTGNQMLALLPIQMGIATFMCLLFFIIAINFVFQFGSAFWFFTGLSTIAGIGNYVFATRKVMKVNSQEISD